MTKTLKQGEIDRKWYLIDAKDCILGRLATRTAVLLTGKDKIKYSPAIDNGDYVVVINSQYIVLSKNKMKTKKYYSHSGYPGGLKVRTAHELHKKDATLLIGKAVNGMLAKNKLQAKRINRIYIYPDANHKQSAQKLIKYEM